MDRFNNTNFPLSNRVEMGKLKNRDEYFKYWQSVTTHFVSNNPESRGLLLSYEMGYGKSLEAITLAHFCKEHDPSKKIVILTMKSLFDNFKVNIEKYYAHTNPEMGQTEIARRIKEDYKFISLNASNMYLQMANAKKTPEEVIFENKMGELNEFLTPDFMENVILIVDEAHLFFNSITNGAKNALNLHDKIVAAKNIKLFFLTGSPMVNSPFELVPCFNMLRGKHIFPELESEFDLYFVDATTNAIKNKGRFQNRILGMYSYYGSLYFDGTPEGFPTVFDPIIETIPMSTEQFSEYSAARSIELKESAGFGQKSERFSAKGSVSSSYRIRSRQISNFYIPEHARGIQIGKKMREKFLDKITRDDLTKNLGVHSPKYKKVLENIQKYNGLPGYVFSFAVHNEGLELFARVLEEHGWGRLRYDSTLAESASGAEFDINIRGGAKAKKAARQKRSPPISYLYAMITGDATHEEQTELARLYSSEENIRGELVSLVLISMVGSHGIELKNSRHSHKLEPYWNKALHNQVDARGARLGSHSMLPKKEQNIQPYLYLSDYPTDFPENKKTELTTDMELYKKMLDGEHLIQSFFNAMAEASVDCVAHEKSFSKSIKEKIKCRMCAATNYPLYYDMLAKDMSIADPCTELHAKKIQVKEVLIEELGEKYYYSVADADDAGAGADADAGKGKVRIYKYNSDIDGYTEAPPNDPLLPQITNYIVKAEKMG